MYNLMLCSGEDSVYIFSDTSTQIVIDKIDRFPIFSQIHGCFRFEIGDMIIVLTAGAGLELKNINRISSACHLLSSTSGVQIKNLFIFTEDLYTPKDNTSEEIIFIKKLVDYIPHKKHRIFHCEQGVNFHLDTLGLNIEYYDWYAADSSTYYKKLVSDNVSIDFNNRICCLNRRFGEHRYLASAVLSNFDDVFVTQQYSLEDTCMRHIDIQRLRDSIKNLAVTGLENLKNKSPLTTRDMPVEQFAELNYTSEDNVLDLYNKTKESFCSLVTESRFNSPLPNFSEKTIRVISAGRPFILLAPAGTLKLLKDLGFKTFEKFWYEGYDDIKDDTERFQEAMTSVTSLLKKEYLDLSQLVPILKHNQEQLEKLPKYMYNLLNIRYNSNIS